MLGNGPSACEKEDRIVAIDYEWRRPLGQSLPTDDQQASEFWSLLRTVRVGNTFRADRLGTREETSVVM